MKEAFKKCMKFMYPEGLPRDECKEQYKMLVQTFTMGWIEAMNLTDDVLWNVAHQESNEMCNPDWYPDKSWRW